MYQITENVFLDDLSIPDETIIYYSKTKGLLQITLILAFLGYAVYTLILRSSNTIAVAIILVGLYYMYGSFKHILNRTPQIILSNKGVQTVSTSFYGWKDILVEEVRCEIEGRSTIKYFTYAYPGGLEKLKIHDYDISGDSLENLLRIYRGRSEKNRKVS